MMKKSTKISEKLKGYSMLAGSFLAASAVQGQVVYTDAGIELGGVPPVEFPHTESQAIDLNNDGVIDFNIILNIDAIDTAQAGYNFREHMAGVDVSNAILYQTYGSYIPFARRVTLGDSIPQTSYFRGAHSVVFATQNGSFSNYRFKNVKGVYIGLKFKVETDVHYAWMRLDVNTADTVPNIIIRDYAYDATPLKKIAAGSGIITGVSNLPENKNAFVVLPNPSNGRCMIRMGKPLTEDAVIVLKDALGVTMYEANVRKSEYHEELPMDFSGFASGIYFITIKSGDLTQTQKWVKR